MNAKTVKALALSAVLMGTGVSLAADRELKLTAPLSPVSYQKVSSGFGALDNTWKLTGVMAFDGKDRVWFQSTTSRAWAKAEMTSGSPTRGELPVGAYVHQLSALTTWDGHRTRSMRVQLAQPIGSGDLYARVVTITVSKEGKDLRGYPDIYDLRDDADLIELASTAAADLKNFPVTGLRLHECDGYIESEGNAFVNLGYFVGPKTRVEMDFQMTELKMSGYFPFGSYGEAGDGKGFLFVLYISHSGDNVPKFSIERWGDDGSAGGVRDAYNCNVADLGRRTIIVDNAATENGYQSYKDGVLEKAWSFKYPVSEKPSVYPLALFARCSNKIASTTDHVSTPVKMKVFGFRIYEDGTLVRNFVPCMKGDVVGLKDLCGGTFVTAHDTTALKYGGDILVEHDDPYVVVGDGPNNGVVGQSLYFYPSYPVGSQTRVELDYALQAPNSFSATSFLFDIYDSSAGEKQAFWILSGTSYAFTMNGTQKYNSPAGNIAKVAVTNTRGLRRTVSMDAGSIALITAGYTNAVATGTPLASTPTKIVIGARNNLTGFIPLRVYGFRFYENGVISRNYVPVVTNGVSGLVDTVLGGFVAPLTQTAANTDTTRLAVAGGNLDAHTTAFEREAYLEFPASGSGLDTGYSAGCNSCIEADFSLWKARGSRQVLIEQKNSDANSSYVALISAGSSSKYQLWFAFADATGTDYAIDTVNDRRQFIADRHAGKLTVKSGDTTLATKNMRNGNTRPGGGTSTLKIGQTDGTMRLYGFKIYEYVNDVKTLKRDFVPAVKDGQAGLLDLCGAAGFIALKDGKVCGKSFEGQSEYQTLPQSTRIEIDGSGTLTCSVREAQSYEWYEDGVKIDGETSASLTLDWKKGMPHVRTYSVVPVYTVFGESWKGTKASATVEYDRYGACLIIR